MSDKFNWRQFCRWLVALAMPMLVVGGPALAKVDFTGKTITLIVPFSRNGGTDLFAQFWMPLIVDNLPGRPKLVIENVTGSGSIKGANMFAAEASTDGLLLLASSASTMFAYLLDDQRVRYNYDDWYPVLIEPSGGVVYASPKVASFGPPASFTGKDQRKNKIKLQTSTQSMVSIRIMILLALEMLGAEYDVEFGAPGGGNAVRAFRDGHINVDMQTSLSYDENTTPLVLRRQAVPLFTVGMWNAEGQIVRDPSFPDLPSFEEFYEMKLGRKPAGMIYEAWRGFNLAGFPSQKMILLPRNTEPEIVESFEKAAAKVIGAAAIYIMNQESVYEPLYGVEASSVYYEALQLDAEIVSWYHNWVKNRYDILF